MTPLLANVLLGFGLAVVIAAAAWRVHSLSPSGALAAAGLGAVIFGLGGLGWAVVLMGFFISSSALSRAFRQRKVRFEEKFSKSGQRDAGQVLANGGVAGLFVIAHVLWPGAAWPWVGFAGALAAANADTWATELGVLSKTAPRLVTDGKVVEQGTSGGVSALGIGAAAAGSLLIGLLAVTFWQGQWLNPAPNGLAGLGWITLAGVLGSLVDSLLGATVQAIYFCPACKKETERHPLHACGTPTRRVRGWTWMDNDWVNAVCTLVGALVACFFS